MIIFAVNLGHEDLNIGKDRTLGYLVPNIYQQLPTKTKENESKGVWFRAKNGELLQTDKRYKSHISVIQSIPAISSGSNTLIPGD